MFGSASQIGFDRTLQNWMLLALAIALVGIVLVQQKPHRRGCGGASQIAVSATWVADEAYADPAAASMSDGGG